MRATEANPRRVERGGAGTTIYGLPAAPGTARGPVCFVSCHADVQRAAGPVVLVLPSASAEWLPWPAGSVAVVSAVGGMLCRSAGVARRRRLPAVFGVGDALAALGDGQIVEVDGDSGVVRLVD